MIDWDDVRFFLAVARQGNVTSAADKMGVNHSTVSRRISGMEQKHGARLFDRLPSGYAMTPAAENILPLAKEIEQKQLELERRLIGKDARLQGELTVTIPHDLANYCILPGLPKWQQQYPDIDVKVVVSPELLNMSTRDADLAIRLTPSPPDYLIGKQICPLAHGIYANRSYARRKKTKPQLILWNHETRLPVWAKEHFPDGEVTLRVDDLSTMYAAVKAGIGIARMPCFLPDIKKDKSIARYPLTILASTWSVWVLSHVDLKETARIKVFKSFLISQLQQQKELISGNTSTYFSSN